MERIPVSKCVKGGVYKLNSRNLSVGVYDGDFGFIGIREKFSTRYLFTEMHYDQGPPNGTASPLEFLNMLPEGIQPTEELRMSTTQNTIHLEPNKALFDYLDYIQAKP